VAQIDYHWMTFHIAQFAQPVAAEEQSFDGPQAAGMWRFGPDSPIGDAGLRTRKGDVWGGLAFYSDRAAAQAVIDDPEKHLAFTDDALQSWHALLCPLSHRGDLNWFDKPNGAPELASCAQDPGGRLVVITSAGYDQLAPELLAADLPRRIDFIHNVDRVKNWYGTRPGNLARGVFQVAPLGNDGMTFTIWSDDESMMENAYHPGIHRTQLDRYKSEKTADRSSFTRARLIQTTGAWDGLWNSANLL
jgi:hypothetical protein